MPREGCVTGRPSPRKDSAASAMMAPATWVVATTISGERILGRICRRTMAASRAPRARAARNMVFGRFNECSGLRSPGEIGPFGEPDHEHQEGHGQAPKGLAAETSEQAR